MVSGAWLRVGKQASNGAWEAARVGRTRPGPGDSAARRVRRGRSGSGGLGEDAFEAAEADQVVGGGDEVPRVARPFEPTEAGPAEAADGLHPAEDLLDGLPNPLADGVARVAGGPAVNGAPPPARVLGDVRGDAAAADVGD